MKNPSGWFEFGWFNTGCVNLVSRGWVEWLLNHKLRITEVGWLVNEQKRSSFVPHAVQLDGSGLGWFPLHSYIITLEGWFVKRWCALLNVVPCSAPVSGLLREVGWIGLVNLRGNSLSSTLLE